MTTARNARNRGYRRKSLSGNDAFRELSEFDFDSEYDRLRWYFEDVLDVEFCVDSRLEYKGAKITLACGGPGIVFDTQSGEVKGSWGFDTFIWAVDYDTRRAVGNYFAEVYDILRGY